jgi:hypothetical protein
MKYCYIILVATCVFILPSCEGCFNKFYAVHENVEYLNIYFDEPSKKSSTVLHYIDFIVAKDTLHYSVDSFINGVLLGKDDRVIHFKQQPEEYYQISCNSAPCWIKGVFNKTLDPVNWIYDRKKITPNDIKRFKLRLNNEILINAN